MGETTPIRWESNNEIKRCASEHGIYCSNRKRVWRWGFKGLLTGAGVHVEATVRQMLQLKQYDRGVRGIRLVTEALLHLQNKSAEKWAAENSEGAMQDLKSHRMAKV